MANLPHIPYDIWEHVARFIPEASLRTLFSVNRSLFHISMNARYRSVDFTAFDDEKMHVLRRLQDAAVAHRVKVLHLETWSVFASHHKQSRNILCSEKIIGAMVDSVRGMLNLTECTIHWRNHLFSQDLLPFFAAAWRTFGHNLQKLTLVAPLARFQTLLSTSIGFGALQDLSLAFDDDDFNRSTADGRILTDIVAPFVNDLCPTLRSLSVSSWSSLNLAPLFHSLKFFPSLQLMKLFVSFEKCGLSDRQGLTRILHDHSNTLQHFEWSPVSGLSIDDSAGQPLIGWMMQNSLDDTILSNLHTLRIVLPPQGLDVILAFVRRSAETLTNLYFEGQHLTYDEVGMIVSVFSHLPAGSGLKFLSLNVETLSLRLLALLSKLPPGLKDLRLHIREVSSEPEPITQPPIYDAGPKAPDTSIHALTKLSLKGHNLSFNDVDIFLGAFSRHFAGQGVQFFSVDLHTLNPQFVDLLARVFPSLRFLHLHTFNLAGDQESAFDGSKLDAFRTAMQKRRYIDWKLEDVQVTSTWSSGPVVHSWEPYLEIAHVLAGCIPSLQTH